MRAENKSEAKSLPHLKQRWRQVFEANRVLFSYWADGYPKTATHLPSVTNDAPLAIFLLHSITIFVHSFQLLTFSVLHSAAISWLLFLLFLFALLFFFSTPALLHQLTRFSCFIDTWALYNGSIFLHHDLILEPDLHSSEQNNTNSKLNAHTQTHSPLYQTVSVLPFQYYGEQLFPSF